jgi:hypothetical protein
MKSRGFCADRSRGDSFLDAELATFRRVNVSNNIAAMLLKALSRSDACEKYRLIAPFQTANAWLEFPRESKMELLLARSMSSVYRDIYVNTVNRLALGSRYVAARRATRQRNYLSVGCIFPAAFPARWIVFLS